MNRFFSFFENKMRTKIYDDITNDDNNCFPELWFEDSDIDFDLETDEILKQLLVTNQLASAHDLEHIFTDDFWEIVNEDIQFNR
jgi:hypothetical protein